MSPEYVVGHEYISESENQTYSVNCRTHKWKQKSRMANNRQQQQ